MGMPVLVGMVMAVLVAGRQEGHAGCPAGGSEASDRRDTRSRRTACRTQRATGSAMMPIDWM